MKAEVAMQLVPCPHCGAPGVAGAPYCGRCQRPAVAAVPRVVTSGPAAAPRRMSRPPPPPREALERDLDVTVPDLKPFGAQPQVPPPLPRAMAPLASVARPTPPPVAMMETVTPAPAPALSTVAVDAHVAPSSRPMVVLPVPKVISQVTGPALPQVKITPMRVAIPGTVRLLLSMIVDGGLLGVVAALLVLGQAISRGRMPYLSSEAWLNDLLVWSASNPGIVLNAAVLTLAIGWAYGVLSAAIGGQTLGRWLTATCLLRSNGARLGIARALVRATLAPLSVLVALAGMTWMVCDRRHRTWHDILCGTVVTTQPPGRPG